MTSQERPFRYKQTEQPNSYFQSEIDLWYLKLYKVLDLTVLQVSIRLQIYRDFQLRDC